MNKYFAPSNYYELLIPKKWSYSEDENLTSFYNESNGVGTLQISGYEISKEYEMNLKNELAEFVAERLSDHIKNVLPNVELIKHLASFKLSSNIFNDTYWEYYMFFDNSKLLLVTYNCKWSDKGLEKESIDTILHSLKIK